jgi:hypothetical protein
MSTNPIPLEVLRIEQPCHAEWNEMAGDDRQRFCQGCQKHVYNFAAMTRDEAERLVCQAAGSLCLRFARDTSGTVVTFDYEKKKGVLARRGWRFWSFVGLFSALLGGFIQSLFGQSPVPPVPVAAPPKPAAGVSTMPVMMGTCPAPYIRPKPPTAPPASPNPLTPPANTGKNS